MEPSTNPSSKQRILCFQSQQSISWQSNQRWCENLEVQITLTDALLSSGWLRSHFTSQKGGATDFIVLLTIAMHARPLRNADLTNLIRLSLAAPQDEGRFYARITDKGLADELGIHRSTVAKSTWRLSSLGFLSILEIPKSQKPYRDSHGLFAGTKIYLLAGEIEQTLPKTLQRIPCIPHDLLGKEKENWEVNSAMSVEPTDCVSLTGTNIRLEDRGEEV